MRKLAAVLAAVALSAASATAVFAAAAAGSGIYMTAHDMNYKLAGQGVKDVQERLCAFCHTPHHAYTTADYPTLSTDGPLWSHGVTTTYYSPYASPRFDSLGGQSMAADALIGPSRLCMSCHDGTVALDTYYGNTGTHAISNNGATNFGAMPLIESNGQKTHPIGFDAVPLVSGATQDTHLWPTMLDNAYLGNADTTLTVKDRLYGGNIFTCSTCHDVHNKVNKTSASISTGSNYFLLGGQTNSGICITCHNQAQDAYGVGVPTAAGSQL